MSLIRFEVIETQYTQRKEDYTYNETQTQER